MRFLIDYYLIYTHNNICKIFLPNNFIAILLFWRSVMKYILSWQMYSHLGLPMRNNYPCKNNGRITYDKHNVLTLSATEIPSKYSRELPKIAECAARLSHVQTHVINSGTHLRIHTVELRGLRDNEISRANYTTGEEGLLYRWRNLRGSRAQTSASGETRKSRAGLLVVIRKSCIEKIIINE